MIFYPNVLKIHFNTNDFCNQTYGRGFGFLDDLAIKQNLFITES